MTQARDLADGKFDTNTLVIDAANNRVGVGTVSPNTSLEVFGAGSTTMRLHRDNASGGGGIDFHNNTQQVANINAGSGTLTLAADPTNAAGSSIISFETDGSEVGRWLAGGGLTFNGDTAAANALDDYEEGTWTPTADSGITFTGTPSGTYIKIGKLVTVFDSLTCDLTNTQAFTIGGLPFDPAAGNEPVVLILNNSSTFDYIPRGRTGTGSIIKGRSPATVSGINLMIQATYHVS